MQPGIRNIRNAWAIGLAVALIVTMPTLADGDIGTGYDFWQTLGSGATSYSFAKDPLPSGFFCSGSEAFDGTVALEGVPLHTKPAGKLGNTDTIVERLEDVKFDSSGFGTTKIAVRALKLESRSPISTTCGKWDVRASLAPGPQPATEMALQLSQACIGIGVFTASLDLNVQIEFINQISNQTLSIVREVSLPTFSDEPFAIGNAAQQCLASQFPSNAQVTVLEGNLQLTARDAFAPGCWCNCAGTVCMPQLPEHEGPDEDHFVVPPCEFFDQPCEDDHDLLDHYTTELIKLQEASVIDEEVNVALDKLVAPKQ